VVPEALRLLFFWVAFDHNQSLLQKNIIVQSPNTQKRERYEVCFFSIFTPCDVAVVGGLGCRISAVS
jgi:hypothetical protein